MGFSRMSQWMVLALMLIYLVTGCGDLEPEMQNTRTVILNMDFDQRSSSRTSSFSPADLGNYKTHLIMVMTSENMVLTSEENLSNSNYLDYRSNQGEYVLYDSDREITLNMNLNTKMKIFAFLFRENYSIGGDQDDNLFSANRDAGYYGESQIITIDDLLSIPANIILKEGSGTDTAGGTDTDTGGGSTDTGGGSTDTGGGSTDTGGGSTDTGGGTDTTAPTVTFSHFNGSTGVAISDNIIITFSEAVRNIDNTEMTDSNINSLITLKLTNASGADITFDGTINGDKTVITINPISNLFYSQAVYVAIGATVEDSADNAITANATFTTTMDPLLEAFYPFDGNANDESGNSYHGQLGDNVDNSTFPTLTTDRYGNADKAFSFDGDDWIALDKYVTVNSIPEITVCAWVWSTDTSNNKFIISFDRSESYRLALNDSMNTNPYVGWDTTDKDGTTDDLGTPSSLGSYEDGNWYHICGWFNSSSTVDKKIFIDGDMVASNSNSHSAKYLGTSSDRYGFIGWGSEASSFNGNGSSTHQGDFMIGKIDDVRIYSRSLSDDEISALYLSEKP